MSESWSGSATILLICREGKSRQIYQAELDFPGVLLVSVQALSHYFRRGTYCPLNGILVDMPTYMQTSEEEKRLLTELVALFPALRIKCQESTGEIRTLPFGAMYPGNMPPADFVRTYCASFAPRMVRTCDRSTHFLPALLSRDLPPDGHLAVRTVTANVSREGCFLVSFEPFAVGDRCWISLVGLKDTAPIPVEVRWVRLWAEESMLPGMGVRFIEIAESQKIEINRLSGQSLMLDDQGLTGL